MLLRKVSTVAAFVACCSSALAAATLSVSPINVTVRPGSATSTVTVRNLSDRPTNVQAQVLEMRQEGGGERLLPASRVAVSPPFAQLQPRQDYVFRVLRLGREPVQGEEAYRLIVRDVPTEANRGSGVVVSVGHSIPVFFQGEGARPAQLEWSASLSKSSIVLRATNTGQIRARIQDVSISDARTSFKFEKASLGFVLPGSSMAWRRPAPKGLGAGPWRLTADLDGAPIDVRIDPDR